MTAAMVSPAIPLCGLRMADVISSGICAAMVGVMVYRTDYYSHEPVKA